MVKEWKKKISIRRRFIDTVIIAILIRLIYSLLIPHPHHHNTKNRDVVRRNDLIQISTAINDYKNKYWERPELDNAINWITISSISKELKNFWLDKKTISDPDKESGVYWLWNARWTWEYLYLVTQDWWFILMAKTELEWWTNWIVCKDGSWLEQWYITSDTDIDYIKLCERVDKSDTCSAKDCTYTIQEEELRRIVITKSQE